MARSFDSLLVLLFGAVITLPLVGLIAGAEQSGKVSENRPRATPPRAFSDDLAPATTLAAWPSGFDAWFADHFAFRDRLIEWNSAVTVLWLDSSAGIANAGRSNSGAVIDPLARTVLKGRGDWFYHFGERMLDDHRGLAPMTRSELVGWKRALEQRQQRLAALGIDYLLVIVPEKQSIYPEHLPRAIRRHGPTRAQQLAAYLHAMSKVHLLYLRSDLERAKTERRTYHRTGTHWNDFGAFQACRRIIEELRPRHPALVPPTESDFEIYTEVRRGRGMLRRLGLQSWVEEETILLTPRQAPAARSVSVRIPEHAPQRRFPMQGSTVVFETERSDLPRAVVLHDSFTFVSLRSQLSEHFERTAYHWMNRLPAGTLERERPDIVIEEHVERFFLRPPPTGAAFSIEKKAGPAAQSGGPGPAAGG